MSSGAKRWQTAVKTNPSPAAANIVAAGGAVYIAEAVEVLSLDAATGAIRWRFTPDAQPAAAQSAADGVSGQPLWSTDLGPTWPYLGVVTGLSVSGDTVYAGAVKRQTATGDSSVGIIAGLDRNTGTLLFEYHAKEYAAASGVASAPVVHENMLLVSDGGGAFLGIDRFTLKEVWRVPTEPGFAGPFARPSLNGNRVYAGANDTYVYSIDAATGKVIWRTTTKASIHESALCGQRVFANNLGIFILDATSGHIIGTLFDDDPNEIPSSGFAVAADRVVFSGLHAAYALPCQ